MASQFDLRNDLAVQAAKSLDAKIEAAIRAAFDAGMDFVRSECLTYEAPNYFDGRPLIDAMVHTISYRAARIDPARETPAEFVRYTRPTDWRAGKPLREN